MSKKEKPILFVSASPQHLQRLRTEQEVQRIEDLLGRSRPNRRRFKPVLKAMWATTATDLRQAIQDHRPEILHFAGHGSGQKGIILEDHEGNPRHLASSTLAKLCELHSDHLKCVVLNACYSVHQARAIIHHVDYVIGMQAVIGDPEAITYSAAFYDSLASNDDVPDAHQHACWELEASFPKGTSDPSEYGRRSRPIADDAPDSLPPYKVPLLIAKKDIGFLGAESQSQGASASRKDFRELRSLCNRTSQVSLIRAAGNLPGNGKHSIHRNESGPDLRAFLASDRPILLVLGGSGSGKSTLLFQIASNNIDGDYIPLFYDAHQAAAESSPIARLARDLRIPEGAIEEGFENLDRDLSLSGQQLLVVIDGINEAPGSFPQKIKSTIEYLASLRLLSIKFIYSCRKIFWEVFIEPVEKLPGTLYFYGCEFGLGRFSHAECRKAFEVYQELYRFQGTVDLLETAFKERIRDPLMLRMVAETYSGKQLPSFAPAVLVFSEYEKLLRKRFRGTLVFDLLELLLSQKVAEARAGKDESDVFDLGKLETPGIVQLLGSRALDTTISPLILLEDEGVILRLNESGTRFRFSYDRLFEYLLGKHLLDRQELLTSRDFVKKLDSAIRFWTKRHFCFAQGLKSEVIRLNLIQPQGCWSFQDPKTTTSLLRRPSLVRDFVEDVLRELVFEQGQSVVNTIRGLDPKVSDPIGLLLRIASDSLYMTPIMLDALFSNNREAMLRSLVGLSRSRSLSEARALGRLVVEKLKSKAFLEMKDFTALIYYSASLFAAADRNNRDPFSDIYEFWQDVLLEVAQGAPKFQEDVAAALSCCIEAEGELFYGKGFTPAGILYPWKDTDSQVRGIAKQLSSSIIADRISLVDIEILRFFAAARKSWEQRRNSREGDLHAYQVEYRIAQWFLIRQASSEFSSVHQVLDTLVAEGDWFLLDFSLTVMTRIIRLTIYDDSDRIKEAFGAMVQWDRKFEREFEEYYRVLDGGDPFAVNSVPLALTAAVDAAFISPSEGPVLILQSELESGVPKRIKMALLALRVLIRRRHCTAKAALRTMQLAIQLTGSSQEMKGWLDVILRDLYLLHPRMTETLLLDMKIGNRRSARIRRRIHLKEVIGVSHNGEALYKSLFLRSADRLKTIAYWHDQMLTSESLDVFCLRAVRDYFAFIRSNQDPSAIS